jgi:hypothetical protein
VAPHSHSRTHTARVCRSVDPDRDRLLAEAPPVLRTRHAERSAALPRIPASDLRGHERWKLGLENVVEVRAAAGSRRGRAEAVGR